MVLAEVTTPGKGDLSGLQFLGGVDEGLLARVADSAINRAVRSSMAGGGAVTWDQKTSLDAGVLARMNDAFTRCVAQVEALIGSVSRSPKARSSFHWGPPPDLTSSCSAKPPSGLSYDRMMTVYELAGQRVGATAYDVTTAHLLPAKDVGKPGSGVYEAYFVKKMFPTGRQTLVAPALPVHAEHLDLVGAIGGGKICLWKDGKPLLVTTAGTAKAYLEHMPKIDALEALGTDSNFVVEKLEAKIDECVDGLDADGLCALHDVLIFRWNCRVAQEPSDRAIDYLGQAADTVRKMIDAPIAAISGTPADIS